MRIDPTLLIRTEFTRVSPELVAEAAGLSSSTLHEAAGRIGALPSTLKPIAATMRCSGSALTVHSPPGDNLWLHRALDIAQPGDVMVVSVSSAYEHGYWGEVMATMAQRRGLAGLVIDGCVRDGELLAGMGLPVFARGLCIRGTGKDFAARGSVNHPVMLGDIVVRAGDLVLADTDGVVVIPRVQAERAIAAGRLRDQEEADIMVRLRSGEATLDVYGWR